MIFYIHFLFEMFLFTFLIYLIKVKRRLAFLYLPLAGMIFSFIAVHHVRNVIYFGLKLLILFIVTRKIIKIDKNNIYSILIIIYFSLLYVIDSPDITSTRSTFISLISLFVTIAVIPELYKRYSREVILQNIYYSSKGILIAFLINVLVSTIFQYTPKEWYGVKTFVSYGNMSQTSFNILPIALFIYLYYNKNKMNSLTTMFSGMVAILISFTLRRGAIGAVIVSIFSYMFLVMVQRKRMNTIKFIFFSIIFVMLISFTSIFSVFIDQMNSRITNENNEIISFEEGRFSDFRLVYEDIFIEKRYSKIFGNKFLENEGNYGGGVMGTRPIHPDIPLLVNISGLLGLFLYLKVMYNVFRTVYKNRITFEDNIVLLWGLIIFAIFSFVGRFTSTGYLVLLISFLYLNMSRPRTGDIKHA